MYKADAKAEQCREFYEAMIEALRYVAYRHGYALAVHGSLRRDIDLLACPWRTSAVSAEALICALVKAARAIAGVAKPRKGDVKPEQKPCGRLAWSFYLTDREDGPYLDISVMPKDLDAA